MIVIDDLRTFVAVAREGSFIAASRATKIPTSTVSRTIARLEATLGVRLLHRTSRRVALTPDGERLLSRVGAHVDGLVDVVVEAQERAREPAGRLRVTAPVVSGAGFIGKSLVAFASAHPRVEVELHLTNEVVDLVAEKLDLGFRAGPIEDAGLVARKVWAAEHALVASSAFVDEALAGRRELSRTELETLPAIVHRSGGRWRFERGVVSPRERFSADDPRVALDAATRGLGIARIPTHLIEPGSTLVVLRGELGPFVPRGLYAVRPSGRAPRRVRMAIEWVARHAPR